MKNNIAFFTHYTDAYNNGKFLLLRAYYGGEKGWAMEAKFWALNCLIGHAENARLNLSSKTKRAEVVKALDLSLSELDEFLRVLSSKEEEIMLLEVVDNCYWTEQTQEDLARAMGAREEAKRRREGRVGLPSGNESQTSGDESGTSGDEKHGQDRTGQEFKELAGLPLVDNFSEAELADLYAFVLERAKADPKVRKPAQWAKRVMLDPEVVQDWREAKAAKERGIAIPAPRIPCVCGGELRFSGATAECRACGRFYHWDDELQAWRPDESDGPVTSPPGMCPTCGRPLQVVPEDPLRARCQCGASLAVDDWGEWAIADAVTPG